MMINANDEVTYQANHTNPLFKELHLPIEAQKEREVEAYWADINQKKDSVAQHANQTKDSISYLVTHDKITFILKGLWDEALSTQLTPVSWGEADTDTKSAAKRIQDPYMAIFKVQHPQYAVYELPVLVTGKKQEITIISGFLSGKEVRYAKAENAKFNKAIQTIDKSQTQVANYNYAIENYPFQNSAFVGYLREAIQQANGAEQKAIESVKKAKKELERYADEKRRHQMH